MINRLVCNGHGKCTLSGNCECERSADAGFWNGSLCENCVTGYFGAACKSECSGGACMPCSGHGSCDEGVTGSGQCTSCTGNWSLPTCSDCLTGYYGTQCEFRCPFMNDKLCGGHGSCSSGTSGNGSCVCSYNWKRTSNTSCDDCAAGYYGPTCAFQCQCGSQATCFDGIFGTGSCKCNYGFVGEKCDIECPKLKNGTYCGGLGVCLPNATCACQNGTYLNIDGNCAYSVTCPCVNGYCRDITSSKCTCNAGWSGSTCTQTCPGGSSIPCNGHGTCQADATCSCFSDSVNGYWGGSGCDGCDPYYLSLECDIPCPSTPAGPCNKQGMCFQGVCYCNENFCGEACHKTICNVGCSYGNFGPSCETCPGPVSKYPYACNGNGLCDGGVAGTGECLCYPGYYGTDCAYTCKGTPYCSGHGICTRSGTCRCMRGFGKSDCSTQCSTGGTNKTCSGHGLCGSLSGSCECFPGYAGTVCQLECSGGANNPCNGHGICQKDSSCLCYANRTKGFWTGASCTVCVDGYGAKTCRKKCVHGKTEGTECSCDPYYGGLDCSKSCPGYLENGVLGICSGNGACRADGTCYCRPNYFTGNCSIFCSISHCQTKYGYQNPSCHPLTGSCLCQNDVDGHWVGSQCDTCDLFWWGTKCNQICLCNGNGGCDQNTGDCTCFSDETRGFWSGTNCDVCSTGYVGVLCQTRDVELSQSDSASIHVEVLDTSTGIQFSDDEYDMKYLGSRPLVLTTIKNETFLEAIDFGGPVSNAFIVNNNVMFVVEKNFSTAYLLTNRGYPIVNQTWNYLPTAAVLSHPNRRLLQQQSSTGTPKASFLNAQFFMTVQSTCALVFADVKTFSITVNTQLQAGWNIVNGAVQLTGERYVLFGSGATRWKMMIVEITGNQISSQTDVTNTVMDCSSSICSEIQMCMKVSSIHVVCALSRQDGIVFGRFTLNSTVLEIRSQVAQIKSANTRKTTAMAFDAWGFGLAAVTFDNEPSVIYKFNSTSLVTTGSFKFSVVGLDPEKVTSLTINSEARSATAVVALPFSFKTMDLNLFGVGFVEPSIVDGIGGTPLIVTGEGFSSSEPVRCKFGDFDTSPATVLDPYRIACDSVQTNVTGVCSRMSVNIVFGNRTSSTSTVNILRPSAPLLEAIRGEARGPYDKTSLITIMGFGFVDSPYLKCKIEGLEFPTLFMNRSNASAVFVNSSTIICIQPPTVPYYTYPPSRLSISLDGFIFSTMSLVYAIVGPIANITVTNPLGVIVVSAKEETILPPITVSLIDSHQNTVGSIDTTRWLIQAILKDATVTDSPFVKGTQILWSHQNSTVAEGRNGEAKFRNLAISRPPLSNFTIRFEMLTSFFENTERWRCEINVVIVLGNPSTISFHPDILKNGLSSWKYGSTKPATLDPAPKLIIEDASGNGYFGSQQSKGLLPQVMYLTYLYAVEIDGFFNHSREVVMVHQNEDNTYVFEQVKTFGLFGWTYTLTFSVDTSFNIPDKVSDRIPVAQCPSGAEYGKLNSPTCLRCPEHATCDGTPAIIVNDDYWRPSEEVTTFYECEQGACSNGTCTEGYRGPKCVICAEGYGNSASKCTKCASRFVNWIQIASLLLMFTMMILFLIKSTLSAVTKNGRHKDMFPIILRMTTSHIQVCGQITYFDIKYPSFIQSFLESQKTAGSFGGDLSFSGVDCESGFNTYEKFMSYSLLPFVVVGIITLLITGSKAKKKFQRWRHLRKNRQGGEFQHEPSVHEQRIAEIQGEDWRAREHSLNKFRSAVLKVMKQTKAIKFLQIEEEKKRKRKKYKFLGFFNQSPLLRLFLMSVVVVLFVLYPTLVTKSMQMLRCDVIDYGPSRGTHSVMTIDPTIECYTPQHQKYYNMGLYFGVGFMVGIPLGSILAVKIVAWLADSMEIATDVFAFMTGGYTPSAWYWEAIIMTRKAVMIGISVFIPYTLMQCYVAMWTLTLMVILNQRVHPYENALLTNLELVSLSTLALTMNIGLVFRHVDTEGPVYWVIFSILVATNFIVLSFFGYFVVKSGLEKFRRWLLSKKDVKHSALVDFLLELQAVKDVPSRPETVKADEEVPTILFSPLDPPQQAVVFSLRPPRPISQLRNTVYAFEDDAGDDECPAEENISPPTIEMNKIAQLRKLKQERTLVNLDLENEKSKLQIEEGFCTVAKTAIKVLLDELNEKQTRKRQIMKTLETL